MASHAPEVFDVVVSIAGYGLGTTEPTSSGFCAPQPESSKIFQDFLRYHAARLAYVPVVLATHAKADSVSSYRDVAAIIDFVKSREGDGIVELITVADDQADSDPRRKKKARLGHNYYNYTLLDDSSEEVFYSVLRDALCRAGGRRELCVPYTPPELKGLPSSSGVNAPTEV